MDGKAINIIAIKMAMLYVSKQNVKQSQGILLETQGPKRVQFVTHGHVWLSWNAFLMLIMIIF